MCKKSISVILLPIIFLTITSGCITVRFETHIGTENNIDIKFETPANSTQSIGFFTATTQIFTDTPEPTPSKTPTLFTTPQANPQFTPSALSEISQFIEKINIPSDTNAGITYTVPYTGTYTFQYSEPGSAIWTGVDWSTFFLAFPGAVPKWLNSDDISGDSALFELGKSGYTTKERAIDATRGKRAILELRRGDVITFVIGDRKTDYGDNVGELVLYIYALVSRSINTPSHAAATQTTDRVFEVSSLIGWQNTGIHISNGERVEISVISGEWTNWRGRAPYTEGEGDSAYICGSPGCVEPLPTVPSGALIGQIGGMTFLIGAGTVILAEVEGNLLLRINDSNGGLYDNDGSLKVKITN
jgi:hypothetical protein